MSKIQGETNSHITNNTITGKTMRKPVTMTRLRNCVPWLESFPHFGHFSLYAERVALHDEQTRGGKVDCGEVD